MSPIGSLHAGLVIRLNWLFSQRAGSRFLVSAQSPIRTDDQSEPQPDVVLLKRRDDFYRKAHPTPADILLVIEVSDSTLDADRRIKVPLYALAGISEVWIVNVSNECVEVYREPEHGDYQEKHTLRGQDILSPLALPEVQITVAEVFA